MRSFPAVSLRKAATACVRRRPSHEARSSETLRITGGWARIRTGHPSRRHRAVPRTRSCQLVPIACRRRRAGRQGKRLYPDSFRRPPRLQHRRCGPRRAGLPLPSVPPLPEYLWLHDRPTGSPTQDSTRTAAARGFRPADQGSSRRRRLSPVILPDLSQCLPQRDRGIAQRIPTRGVTLSLRSLTRRPPHSAASRRHLALIPTLLGRSLASMTVSVQDRLSGLGIRCRQHEASRTQCTRRH